MLLFHPVGWQPGAPGVGADFWGPFFIVLLYSSLILWGQLKVVPGPSPEALPLSNLHPPLRTGWRAQLRRRLNCSSASHNPQ